MGSKRNKLKKVFSPSSTSPPPMNQDDHELVDDLLAHLDSRDDSVRGESATVLKEMQLDQQITQVDTEKQDAKGRFRARQTRKAAALAQTYSPDDPEADARIQKEAQDEEKDIARICNELNVQIHEINPDGHCLFSAVADQLALLNILPDATYVTVRIAASTYIWSHPDDFLPFLPSASGEDGAGATDAGIMSPKEFEHYCISIRDTGKWGGEPEIQALSRAYNVPIHVVQSGSPPVVVHNPFGEAITGDVKGSKVVRISYHRRMYGLGEHYNSLRPTSNLAQLSSTLHALIN